MKEGKVSFQVWIDPSIKESFKRAYPNSMNTQTEILISDHLGLVKPRCEIERELNEIEEQCSILKKRKTELVNIKIQAKVRRDEELRARKEDIKLLFTSNRGTYMPPTDKWKDSNNPAIRLKALRLDYTEGEVWRVLNEDNGVPI